MNLKQTEAEIIKILEPIDITNRLTIIERLGKRWRLENNIRMNSEIRDLNRTLGLTKKNIDIGKPPKKRLLLD